MNRAGKHRDRVKREPVVLQWTDLAIHHYVIARAATFWKFHPTAEIQGHHAIEFALKWALVRPLRPVWKPHNAQIEGRARVRTHEEVRAVGHSLPKLWRMLDEDYPNHGLGRFAAYVAFMDRVEPLRYGGYGGYAATMAEAKRVIGGETYAVDLPKFDELLRGLLELTETDAHLIKGIVDPGWMSRPPGDVSPTQNYYLRDNAHALWPG